MDANITSVQPKKKKKKKLIIALSVTAVLLAVVLCFTAVVAFEVVRFALTRDYVLSSGDVPTLFGYTVFRAQTDSMYPEFSAGAYLIGDPDFDPADLRPGDIITYWTVISSGERVLNTHRIENIYDGGDYLIFETKGDNNTMADPLTVHEREIVSVYKFSFGG